MFSSSSIFHANTDKVRRRAYDNLLQMLQRSVWSQLAGIGRFQNISSSLSRLEFVKKKTLIACNYLGPIKDTYNHIGNTMEMLPEDEKHWFGGGLRSVAAAMRLVKNNQIIAISTDTIYGFAGLAQKDTSINKIYTLKGRDKTKPLAICLSSVADIENWAEIDHIPFRLLTDLLPGPVTVVLKRKTKLNPALNPGHESVGIRIPRSKFIRHVCKQLGEPLALTSANLSNQPSSLHPSEFSDLWPQLGGIFYDISKKNSLCDSQRVGSTVVDLTIPGKFKILRKGVRYGQDLGILKQYCMPINPEGEESAIVNDNIAACWSEK